MGHQDVMIQRLEVEADEIASFVHKKANKQWIWIAMDAQTRQVMAFHVGDRSGVSTDHLYGFGRIIVQSFRIGGLSLI
jgi:IS1 transposase